MSNSEVMRQRLMVVLAAAAASAALSLLGIALHRRARTHREIARREELLDEAICETMDASDAVARY